MKTATFAVLKRVTLALSAVLLLLVAGACTVEQEEEGNLPEYEVEQTEEGQMPEYDVEGADVEVGTEEETITVPDVDVTTEEETVTVPDVDVEPPADEDEGGGQQ